MHYFFKLFFIALYLISSHPSAHASFAFEDLPKECTIPTTLSNKSEMPILYPVFNNNLRRKTGNPIEAEGAAIRIEGKLVDTSCVPIMGAKITLLHVNASGIMQSPFGYEDDAATKADPYFAGNGTAYSDNEGVFTFFSIRPKALNNEESFAQITFSHKDFSPFTGLLTFPLDIASSKTLLYGPQKIYVDTETNETVYSFLIIIEGKDPYRQY